MVVVLLACLLAKASAQICNTGQKQSPIDIISSTARYQEYRPFELEGHDKLSIKAGTLYVTNEKGTVEDPPGNIGAGGNVKLKSTEKHSNAFLRGGPLNVDYEFEQLHFHWGDVDGKDFFQGAEHKIDGKGFPIGAHMVHRNIHDDTLDLAKLHENGIAVLGLKFEVPDKVRQPGPPRGNISPGRRNLGLQLLRDIIFEKLRKPESKFKSEDLRRMHPPDSLEDVNVVHFLPALMDEYYHYKGSLTTGSCDEAVNWIVFKHPLKIRIDQLKAFQYIVDLNGKYVLNNFRDTQPVNNRPIFYHGPELLQKGVTTTGAAAQHAVPPAREKFLLTYPNCWIYPSYPKPAPLADAEKDREDMTLWGRMKYSTNSEVCGQSPSVRRLTSFRSVVGPGGPAGFGAPPGPGGFNRLGGSNGLNALGGFHGPGEIGGGLQSRAFMTNRGILSVGEQGQNVYPGGGHSSNGRIHGENGRKGKEAGGGGGGGHG